MVKPSLLWLFWMFITSFTALIISQPLLAIGFFFSGFIMAIKELIRENIF